MRSVYVYVCTVQGCTVHVRPVPILSVYYLYTQRYDIDTTHLCFH